MFLACLSLSSRRRASFSSSPWTLEPPSPSCPRSSAQGWVWISGQMVSWRLLPTQNSELKVLGRWILWSWNAPLGQHCFDCGHWSLRSSPLIAMAGQRFTLTTTLSPTSPHPPFGHMDTVSRSKYPKTPKPQNPKTPKAAI